MTLFDNLGEEVERPPDGLVYRPDFLSVAEESDLIDWIDGNDWNHEYSRRRQFYGRSYNHPGVTTEIPAPFLNLAARLFDEGLVTAPPDHVLINDYLPGQGIGAHLDQMPHPESQVVTISLLDSYPMLFTRIVTGVTFEQWLQRRSVAVMSDASRTDWTHEIVKRKADGIQSGGRRVRGRRVSITYRTMLDLI
jgi:alkylated DNA repair dioxygenase AlkB